MTSIEQRDAQAVLSGIDDLLPTVRQRAQEAERVREQERIRERRGHDRGWDHEL